MIRKSNREIENIHLRGEDITGVYWGSKEIWVPSNVISCYASGYWFDSYPWTDVDSWKDIP